MKINILRVQLTSLGCRDGNRKERGTGGEQGKAAKSVVPPCRAAAHPKNNFPVPKWRRRRQALPKATLILSRKSPSFIVLKPELPPSSGKQQENSSLQAWIQSCQEKNSVKTAQKWYYGSFCLQLGPGRAGLCAQIGGIPAKNIPPCHVCAGTSLWMGEGHGSEEKPQKCLVWCCAGVRSHPRKATAMGTGAHTGQGLIQFIYT